MLIHALITLLTLNDPSGPVGCVKDTDCKGERICNAEAQCVDPPAPAPAPTLSEVTSDTLPPPSPTRPRMHPYHTPPSRYATVHPYSAPGVACIVMGVLGVGIGTAVLVDYRNKFSAATSDALVGGFDPRHSESLADLAAKGPTVYAGTGVAITVSVALTVTGIVLASVKENVRIAYDPRLGLGFRF